MPHPAGESAGGMGHLPFAAAKKIVALAWIATIFAAAVRLHGWMDKP